ncbi:tannase/feruloyl esterase family alpha/beta hydrolase [Paraburkholderia silvatlantica]|uniref:tannase/feruloyl esterase family alpha/beta hydrolase n=1 Tax=Paraburkholderia silvatlantica TaxID=321895 RepID=UPI00105BDC80|nr:tannase/feruloyl esterase family alpha/beta hydrolase [Paraburkholderia silvatlantica]
MGLSRRVIGCPALVDHLRKDTTNWVGHGTPPARQAVTDTAGVPGSTQPPCQFPAWPSYNGASGVNSAKSFTCVQG